MQTVRDKVPVSEGQTLAGLIVLVLQVPTGSLYDARVMLQFTLLSVLLAVGSGPGQIPQDRQAIPQISVAKYLLDLKFEGLLVGEINPSKKMAKATTKSPTLQAHKATLKFFPGEVANRGNYQLTVGARTVAGEWNIDEEVVHLWIDKIDRVDYGGTSEMMFRVPRFVDDGWITQTFPNEEGSPVKGKLVMSNVPKTKYHMRVSGARLSPSRTEIVFQKSTRS